MNVVIYRVPLGRSIVSPPSACPGCGTELRARDNIPVVSYVILRGRCRSCGQAIGLRYPFVELVVAALAVVSALRFGGGEVSAFVASFGAIFIALTAIDLEHRRLPNAIVLPSIGAASAWVAGVAIAHREVAIVERAAFCAVVAFSVLL
jgi:leader peptidase (prepilin peptidase)/N-methyltransferase